MITDKTKDMKHVLEFINSMMKPKQTEKKKYGEVFTPFHLVDDMLDRLPDTVWSDPSLRWFDPCVGIGNFMVSVYYRLMDGLRDIFTDDTDRSRHILSDMLYMSEINAKNVLMVKKIFGDDVNIDL